MQRIRSGRALTAMAAIVAMLAMAASAQAATPAPGFEEFRGCQTPAENPKSYECVHSVIKSGHFEMGNKDVPITNPIHLTGNFDVEAENFGFNSEGGLKPAKQKVPGGVVGLTGLTWLLELLGSDALTLYAVTEAVGSPSNPILLHLTTGTTSPPPPNTPISGVDPTIEFDVPREAILAKNGKFVDNAFAAPGASGCTLTLFGFIPVSINGLVNTQSELPAPAGTNETIQYIDSEFAPVYRVYP